MSDTPFIGFGAITLRRILLRARIVWAHLDRTGITREDAAEIGRCLLDATDPMSLVGSFDAEIRADWYSRELPEEKRIEACAARLVHVVLVNRAMRQGRIAGFVPPDARPFAN